MRSALNRVIDTLIILSLLTGAIMFYATDDGGIEDEAEASPVDAKVQQYCSMAEDNPSVPLDVRKACLARKKKLEDEQEITPSSEPRSSIQPDFKTIYKI
jgi:hypothetical protein